MRLLNSLSSTKSAQKVHALQTFRIKIPQRVQETQQQGNSLQIDFVPNRFSGTYQCSELQTIIYHPIYLVSKAKIAKFSIDVSPETNLCNQKQKENIIYKIAKWHFKVVTQLNCLSLVKFLVIKKLPHALNLFRYQQTTVMLAKRL